MKNVILLAVFGFFGLAHAQVADEVLVKMKEVELQQVCNQARFCAMTDHQESRDLGQSIIEVLQSAIKNSEGLEADAKVAAYNEVLNFSKEVLRDTCEIEESFHQFDADVAEAINIRNKLRKWLFAHGTKVRSVETSQVNGEVSGGSVLSFGAVSGEFEGYASELIGDFANGEVFELDRTFEDDKKFEIAQQFVNAQENHPDLKFDTPRDRECYETASETVNSRGIPHYTFSEFEVFKKLREKFNRKLTQLTTKPLRPTDRAKVEALILWGENSYVSFLRARPYGGPADLKPTMTRVPDRGRIKNFFRRPGNYLSVNKKEECRAMRRYYIGEGSRKKLHIR